MPYNRTGVIYVLNRCINIEKNLARRQLIVKSNESSSWFIEIKYILRKYNLQEARWYLDNPPKKSVYILFRNSSSCIRGVAFGIIRSMPYNRTGVIYVLNRCINVSGSRPLFPWYPPPKSPKVWR
jgi:hypothetical protein